LKHPRIIVTGASGFVGRHLVEALERNHGIFALARGGPASRGFPPPVSVSWLTADIGQAADVTRAFEHIRAAGGAEILIHLAGHYDFTGEDHPEYQRTNVDGTRHVLQAAARLGIRDVVFASSLAACQFPPVGTPITERTPPDGHTPYAVSKRAGEQLVREHRAHFRGWIVRFAALFSDWCEYEPVFRFLETWLSRSPNGRMLAGKGLSAVPYLHIRDAVAFLGRLIAQRDQLDPDLPLIASTDGATTHRELFEVATAAHFGERGSPLLVPRPLCAAWLWMQERLSQCGLEPPFERLWMTRMIDLALSADAGFTRRRLGWAPRPRLDILRRMPFLVHNRSAFATEWQRRNHAALRRVRLHENLHVYRQLETRAAAIRAQVTDYILEPGRAGRFEGLAGLGRDELGAEVHRLFGALLDAVRTADKWLFSAFCRDVAARRLREGFALEELAAVLDVLADLCVLALAGDGSGRAWSRALYDHVTMTVQFGRDAVQDLADAD
jgi:nucleoside-diphosphate-sugar epimerase